MIGKFIVIEGIEGAGKSTAINTVLGTLAAFGITNVVRTREPGGTNIAEKLRQLIKEDNSEQLTDLSELLLLYAARVQLVENVIKPALFDHKWVIGDRHDMSSQAYQGGGRRMDQQLLKTMRDLTLKDFYPDLTIYMDIDPSVGMARAQERGQLDRIEKMDISFFERTRERYLELALNDPNVIIIDASKSLGQVSLELQARLAQWLRSMIK